MITATAAMAHTPICLSVPSINGADWMSHASSPAMTITTTMKMSGLMYQAHQLG